MKADRRKLPPGWSWVRLRDHVVEVQAFSPRSFPAAMFKYIDITSVDNVRKRVIGSKAYEREKAPARAQSIVAENDILVSTVRPNLNAVALLTAEHDGFVCSSGFCVVRLGNGQHPSYYFRLLTSPYFVNRMTDLVQGAMYPAISDADVLDTPFPLPPNLDDQVVIAAELERKLSKVESMRQAAESQMEAAAAMEAALLGQVLHTGKDDLLPYGWHYEPLAKVCDINPRRRANAGLSLDAMTSFVPMEAIDEKAGEIGRRITRPFSAVAKGYTCFEDGDVLFAKITPCMQNGKSAIASGLTGGFGFGTTEFHVLRAGPDILREWIFSLVRTREFRDAAKAKFDGSAGQQRVPLDFMNNYPVPLPPTIGEQREIVKRIARQRKAVRTIREAATRQLDALSVFPRAILREAFDFAEA